MHFLGLTYISSCFLLFLISANLVYKYSRNWTKQKPTALFSTECSRTSKKSRRRPAGGAPHRAARLGPLLRPGVGSPPLAPPTLPLRLYIPSSPKTLERSVFRHEKLRSRRHREDKFRGTESLFRHAAGTGKCPRKASPLTPPPPSCSVSSSPMDYGF